MLDAREKARISWHCRRGMLELDLILTKFLDTDFDRLTDNQVRIFDQMLSNTDPDLFAWLMGHNDPECNELNEIVALIRNSN